jgi:hypothetical protein
VTATSDRVRGRRRRGGGHGGGHQVEEGDRAADPADPGLPADDPSPAGPPSGWQPTLHVRHRGGAGPVLGGLAVVAALLAGGAAATRLPPGTTLAGTPVADAGDAPAALDAAEAALARLRVRLVTDAGTQVELTGAELGLGVDRSVSAAPVDRGLPSIGAWVAAVPEGGPDVPLAVAPPPPDALARVAEQLTRAPVDADLVVQPEGVEVVAGADGIAVDAGQAAAALTDALRQVVTTAPAAWPAVVEATAVGEVTSPVVDQQDIDAATARIDEVARAQVSVTAQVPAVLSEGEAPPEEADDGGAADGGPAGAAPGAAREAATIALEQRELRAVLGVEPDPGAPAGQRLRVVASPETAPPRLVALIESARVQPSVEATVVGPPPDVDRGDDVEDVALISGEVVVEGQTPGFEPDRAATVAAVVDAALSGGGTVEVVGADAPPVDPAALGIVQPVSTFTTFYTPGQSRNTNIQRIAELVDGVVIPAGESFELNHFVGRRTVENGFALGGAILDGELVSDIGGGVSQFATTFFNAAWFSGIELVDWKPHSFYFDRYPAGREATINYPNVNLEVRNDTPHAILVDTHADEDSVTVSFWSTPHWQVQTNTGPCGCGGSFSITVDRIRTAPGGQPIEESYTTTYTVPRAQ